MTLHALRSGFLALTFLALPTRLSAQSLAAIAPARLATLYEEALGTPDLMERDAQPAKRAMPSSLPALSGRVSYNVDERGAVIVRQLDPDHLNAMAAVGDSLTIITNEGRIARVPVLGRSRYRSAVNCEGTSYLNRVGGWLFVVAPIPGLAPENHRDGMAIVSPLPAGEISLPVAPLATAMPVMAPLRAIIAKSATTAVAQAVDQRSGAAIRRRLLGARGLGPIGAKAEDALERTLTLRGPGGTSLQFVSVSLDDDPGDHDNSTKATLILDPRGTPVLNVPRYFRAIAVADLDGDGVSEVLTDSGIIRWDGRAWRLPPAIKGTCD